MPTSKPIKINPYRRNVLKKIGLLIFCLSFVMVSFAQPSDPAPDRQRGEGPYERLIIRGAIVIDGTGAPPGGPMDIAIEGNKIVAVEGYRSENVQLSNAWGRVGRTNGTNS